VLRLTALCPPDQTEAVVAALREAPDTETVLCVCGVEVETGHDMVTAFIPRGSIAVVLGCLRALRRWCLDERNPIRPDCSKVVCDRRHCNSALFKR